VVAAPVVSAPEVQAPAATALPTAGMPSPAAAVVPAVVRQPATPSTPAEWIAAGDAAMAARNYEGAVQAYASAVNSDPADARTRFKLANALAVNGHAGKAIEQWGHVLRSSPDAALRAAAQENISRVRGSAPQAAAASPTSQLSRQAYEQGLRSIQARDYAGAYAAFSQALTMEPTLAVAHAARGSALVGLGRYPEAVADYRNALQLDGNMAAPRYGMAECYKALGLNAEARAEYERYAASTAPDVVPALQADARHKAQLLR
jgi:superkiller protein 3